MKKAIKKRLFNTPYDEMSNWDKVELFRFTTELQQNKIDKLVKEGEIIKKRAESLGVDFSKPIDFDWSSFPDPFEKERKKQEKERKKQEQDREIKEKKDKEDWEKYVKSELGKGYIYLRKSLNLYKIGITEQPQKRDKQYRTENPHIELIFQKEIEDYINVEKKLLKKFKDKLDKGREWFRLDNQDINWIKANI